MNAADELVTVPQENVGDRYKFQALLKLESVVVPAFLAPREEALGDEPLDTARYISRDFHEREKQKLWPRAWQLVAREEQLANAGDHVVYDIVDRSVIVMRGADGTIRGFYNSCLHRGRALRNVSGNVCELRCPFHGFTWDLEGGFKSLPCAWDFGHLKKNELHLPQVRVECWGGFVFISFDENAMPLREYLGPLPEHFAGYGFERSSTLAHVQRRIACNWKVGQEAFFESLHVRATHPQLMTFIDDVDSQYDVLGEHVTRMVTPMSEPSPHLAAVTAQRILRDSLLTTGMLAADAETPAMPAGMSPRRFLGEMNRQVFSQLTGADLSQATLSELQDSILYSVFPNLQIWAGYFGNIVYRFIPDGDNPDRCLFDVRLLGRHPAGAQRPPAPPVHRLGDDESFAAHAPELGGLGAVFDQDMRNLPYMTKGLKASGSRAIQLAHYQESRIRHHHLVLDRYLGIKPIQEKAE